MKSRNIIHISMVPSFIFGLLLSTSMLKPTHSYVLHIPTSIVKRVLNIETSKTLYIGDDFNNCPQEEPFPCKTNGRCISLKHVCDGNFDCPDQYDEDQAVCIAYQRVPAEDLLKFVQQQASWLIPSFFSQVVKSPADLAKISSALSTSPNIDIFQSKLRLSRQATKKFESALYAVRSDDMRTLEQFGMSPDSWVEVKLVFKNLIDSGLL